MTTLYAPRPIILNIFESPLFTKSTLKFVEIPETRRFFSMEDLAEGVKMIIVAALTQKVEDHFSLINVVVEEADRFQSSKKTRPGISSLIWKKFAKNMMWMPGRSLVALGLNTRSQLCSNSP